VGGVIEVSGGGDWQIICTMYKRMERKVVWGGDVGRRKGSRLPLSILISHLFFFHPFSYTYVRTEGIWLTAAPL
jgi:hypothetical protein